jgi:hypothetical protein
MVEQSRGDLQKTSQEAILEKIEAPMKRLKLT